MYIYIKKKKRSHFPISDLRIGHNCGSSLIWREMKEKENEEEKPEMEVGIKRKRCESKTLICFQIFNIYEVNNLPINY